MDKIKTIIVLLSFPLFSCAQYTRSDIFKDAPLTWLGIDFSRVKVEGYSYPTSQYKEVFFPIWNEMVRNKEDNLKIVHYLHRDEISVEIDAINNINAGITRNILTPAPVERSDLAKLIRSYDLPNNNRIGVIVFATDIVHQGERFYGKIAFVDLKTKEILLLKKIEGSGSGFGFRNTWAHAIKNSMKFVQKHWRKWEKQVNEAETNEHAG